MDVLAIPVTLTSLTSTSPWQRFMTEQQTVFCFQFLRFEEESS